MNNTKNGTTSNANAQRIRRACALIVPLFFFALLLSAALISAANDIYAFVKPDREITLTLEPQERVYDTAKLLSENGVIKNPALFSLYARTKGAEERILGFSGEISLSTAMSYREILRSFL